MGIDVVYDSSIEAGDSVVAVAGINGRIVEQPNSVARSTWGTRKLKADGAGEVFVEIGLAIKQKSPFKNTFVIELCNDDIAYVPTRKAFTEGGYETVNSLVKSGGGEMLVEAVTNLLRELKKLK